MLSSQVQAGRRCDARSSLLANRTMKGSDTMPSYSMLSYSEYIEHIDYWTSHGLTLPKFVEQVCAEGGKPVSAVDFYDSIFGVCGEELEETHKGHPEAYQTGEYGAIALELIPSYDAQGHEKRRPRHRTVTRGCEELYDLIDSSNNFCMMSPISYAGRNRTVKNARELYALTIEIDNIQEKKGVSELFYTFERKTHQMPRPTYIVCSGSGLHLYYVFERPIRLFPNVYKQLSRAKKYFTQWLWDKPVTRSFERNQIQFESVNQPFRIVGTVCKDGHSRAMAFETGNKITVESLNELLPDEDKIPTLYKSELTLQKAKELYPDWYERRIVQGKRKSFYKRHPGVYRSWINRCLEGATVSHRYFCLENLCALAVQCDIDEETLLKDADMLTEYFETLTKSEDNHFTEQDKQDALRTYYRSKEIEKSNSDVDGDDKDFVESTYYRSLDTILDRTGIDLKSHRTKRNEPAKRLRRTEQLKIATFKRDIMYPNGTWREGSGRKPKGQIVADWRSEHPNGKKAECIRDTGLSRPTVYKWWDFNKKEKEGE